MRSMRRLWRAFQERWIVVDKWLLDHFTHWFCSQGGVWQTGAITALIVVGEASGFIHDQHGFWLLYWLTVYSAVTQPMLAHSGAESAKHMETLIVRVESLEETVLTRLNRIDARMDRIETKFSNQSTTA